MSAPSVSRRLSRSAASHTLTVLVVLAAAGWGIFFRPPLFGGDFSYLIVSGDSMRPTLSSGDLVLARPQSTYATGDILAYEVPQGEPGAGVLVIHRVTGGSARTGYRVQGDNREGPDPWRPTPADVRGKMVASVPKVGLPLAYLGTPLGLGAIAALLAFVLVLPRRRDSGTVKVAP